MRIGEAVIRPTGHTGRCLVTSRDPETGVSDLDTLGLLATYRRDVESTEPLSCGVHAAVDRPGRVRLGDAVERG